MFVVLVVLTSANYLTRTKHDAKQRKPPPDVGGQEEVSFISSRPFWPNWALIPGAPSRQSRIMMSSTVKTLESSYSFSCLAMGVSCGFLQDSHFKTDVDHP